VQLELLLQGGRVQRGPGVRLHGCSERRRGIVRQQLPADPTPQI
jgi:hypothetical protein